MGLHEFLYTGAGFFAGVAGTGLGGFLSLFFNRRGNRFLSAVLEYTAGLMLAVSLLDLLPASFEGAPLITVLCGVVAGIALVFFVDELTGGETSKSAGLSMAFSIALHNFPEGLAIGSAFESNAKLGFTIFIAIMLHNIPEGVGLSVPLKYGGASAAKTVLTAALAGVPMGIGAFIGVVAGVSDFFVSVCLAFAAGAMLYVVLIDMLPQSQKLSGERSTAFFSVLGVISGVIISSGLG
ncbi:MAG: ZIP family metal transporter [Bacillota bacterium]|nr:ZIP family metal transporter [Bacillota bacterium]